MSVRKVYIRPESHKIPYHEPVMAIKGSLYTDEADAKSFDVGDNYGDFLSSFERGKEIDPLRED